MALYCAIILAVHMLDAIPEAGGHTVSVDEMTGIQALEHRYPDKLVMPGKPARMEFEYIRHGTTSLIGFFDVATGRMEKPYLNSTRTEEDFVKAVRALIETDLDASRTFVCDGLNTHRSESLIQFVAEQCCIEGGLGHKGKDGILKNLASRTDFLHDKGHRIRFVYTPKHCSWRNQLEVWSGIINRRRLRRKSCQSVQQLDESILCFIKQYRARVCFLNAIIKNADLTNTSFKYSKFDNVKFENAGWNMVFEIGEDTGDYLEGNMP